MRRPGAGILVLAALLLAPSCLAVSAETAESEFEAYLSELLDKHDVAGVSIALVEDGALGALLTAGLASTDSGAPVTADSVFQVGSVSKPVAAWTAMTLVQSGELELDEPVGDYLTRWQIPQSEFDADEVTLRRLLSHTAGLSLHGYAGFPMAAALPSAEESLSGATNGSGAVYLQAQPGSAFSYSGGGYTLMQLLVEEITGMPFSDYASAAVLEPLGMKSSSYVPDRDLQVRVAAPHDFSRGVVPSAQK